MIERLVQIVGKEEMSTVSVRISKEEKEKLQRLADELDLSLSYIIRKAIREIINK